MTLRELELREEARTLQLWDAVVTIQELLERIATRGTTERHRSWAELHPLRVKLPDPRDPDAPRGFDQLKELARL